MREALDVADLSHASAMYLTAFIQTLIPNYPEWATQQLVIIYRERGGPSSVKNSVRPRLHRSDRTIGVKVNGAPNIDVTWSSNGRQTELEPRNGKSRCPERS